MAQNDINAAARAIFCVIKPSNMIDSDWDSSTVLGLGNALRDQCINAARAALAAVPASEPVGDDQWKLAAQKTDWCPHCGQGWGCAVREAEYRHKLEALSCVAPAPMVPSSMREPEAAPAPVSGMPDLAGMRQAFRTTQTTPRDSGLNNYRMVFEFTSLKHMYDANDEWLKFTALPVPQAPDALENSANNSSSSVAAPLPAAPAPTDQEAIGVFAIEVEKMLCAALGREWSVCGISIESLIAVLAARPAPDSRDAALEEAAVECEREKWYEGAYQASQEHNSAWEAAKAIRALKGPAQ